MIPGLSTTSFVVRRCKTNRGKGGDSDLWIDLLTPGKFYEIRLTGCDWRPGVREIFIMESDKHDSRYGPEYLFEYQAIESAVVTPTNAGPKKCDCDLRSVIMVTGCVCGGC